MTFTGAVSQANPWGLIDVPYERELVMFVDDLIQLAKSNGSKDRVETTKDWQTIEFIYKGWLILYPITSREFESHMKEWRRASNPLGVTKEKGGAALQHQLNLPRPLHDMIKTIFPRQPWDKKFVAAFIKRFGMFKGSDKL